MKKRVLLSIGTFLFIQVFFAIGYYLSGKELARSAWLCRVYVSSVLSGILLAGSAWVFASLSED